MNKNKILQKDYTLSSLYYQIKLPLDLEILIPADDPVRLLSAFVEGMELSDLYKTYGKIKKNQASPRQLFKIIIYASMNRIYSSRDIETACHRDINFMYLLEVPEPPRHRLLSHLPRGRCAVPGNGLQVLPHIHLLVPHFSERRRRGAERGRTQVLRRAVLRLPRQGHGAGRHPLPLRNAPAPGQDGRLHQPQGRRLLRALRHHGDGALQGPGDLLADLQRGRQPDEHAHADLPVHELRHHPQPGRHPARGGAEGLAGDSQRVRRRGHRGQARTRDQPGLPDRLHALLRADLSGAKSSKTPHSSAAVPTGRMKSSALPRCTTIR